MYKWFSVGRCPICKGNGFTETKRKAIIDCLVIWNPESRFSNDTSFTPAGTEGSTTVQLKTDTKHFELLRDCSKIVVDDVEVGISEKGRRSLAASEIHRLNRLAVLSFLKLNYRKAIQDTDFTLSASKVRAIIVFLNVNQMEFGLLVGCQKSKVSKILRSEQEISKSQSLLALERLAMELAQAGSTRKLLGDESVQVIDYDELFLKQLSDLRFSSAA